MRRRTFMLGTAALAASGPTAQAHPWDDSDDAVIPRSEWYATSTRERWGAWGPPVRQFPAPAGLAADPLELRRRVIAAAQRYVGLGYQHHHVPGFAPPQNWPWLNVSAGQNGEGLDCSNFTSLAFNSALGIKLPTAIGVQAETTVVAGPGGQGSVTLRRIAPESYGDARMVLRPADLVFIRSDAGRVSHVVLWLGVVGSTPSILDCTDAVRHTAAGTPIPTGVRVRPFLPDNWYGRRFAHAHRLENLGTGSGPAPHFDDGGDV